MGPASGTNLALTPRPISASLRATAAAESEAPDGVAWVGMVDALRCGEAACRTASAAKPDDVRLQLLLAEMLLQRDSPDEAIKIASEAARLMPENAAAHFCLGRAQHLAGNLAAALAAYKAAVAAQPEMALAYCNLAFVQLELEDYAAAATSGRAAIALDRRCSSSHLVTGRALFALYRADLAEPYLRRAVDLDPAQAGALNALARVLQHLGQSEHAIILHERALAAGGDSAIAWHGLGLAYRALGRFDRAIEAFTRTIELRPGFADARRDLAICKRASGEHTMLQPLLLAFHADASPVAQRVAAGFALGKQLDDLGLYDEAFQHYAEANRLVRTAAGERRKLFSAQEFHRHIDSLISRFSPALFLESQSIGVGSILPIFVVGHYRAGTTLTEQVLASHPAIHGAGELQNLLHLGRIVMRHWARHGSIHKTSLQREAVKHLKRLRAIGGPATRVVDKHPDNVLALGLIALMFPQARVIVCHRDIRDNVLSCYFQRFSEGMSFSNDLDDCARRHLEIERLISHWRTVLPLRMLELQYEDLVGDFKTNARRLIEFVGLPWDNACLKFYETERTVNTPSAWGVRQPIYATSVGRWQNYVRHITPVLDVMQLECELPSSSIAAGIKAGSVIS